MCNGFQIVGAFGNMFFFVNGHWKVKNVALPPKRCGNKWFSSLSMSAQAQPPQHQQSKATWCLQGGCLHVNVLVALSFVWVGRPPPFSKAAGEIPKTS